MNKNRLIDIKIDFLLIYPRSTKVPKTSLFIKNFLLFPRHKNVKNNHNILVLMHEILEACRVLLAGVWVHSTLAKSEFISPSV